jgi:hypothetical protein
MAANYSRVKSDTSAREDVAPDVVQDAINTLTAIRMTGTWTPGAVPARFGKKMIAAAAQPVGLTSRWAFRSAVLPLSP